VVDKQTIYVIDDEIEICEGLRWLLESVNFRVETYNNAKIFLDNFHSNQCLGCAIIDVRMPILSGLELLETLKVQGSHLPVIIITGYGDIPMAVRAMKAGAIDFVLKPINPEQLLKTVQDCLKNQIKPKDKNLTPEQQRLQNLSEREKQVLKLIIDGKLNKQIAHELTISLSTVEAHRSKIMHKLQVNNLPQLIKLYLQNTTIE